MVRVDVHPIAPLKPGELMGPTSPLLLLNNAHAEELSVLSPERLAHLVDEAFMSCCIGEADAPSTPSTCIT